MTRHEETLCDVLHPGKTCIESANDAIDALNRDRSSKRAKLAAVAAVMAATMDEHNRPLGFEDRCLCLGCNLVRAIRKALADPDAALERVRAEARAEVAEEIALAIERNATKQRGNFRLGVEAGAWIARSKAVQL